MDFAFLKATEGSSLQDVRFAQNWANAQAAGVRVGAYHFFSYDSPGETQADNFISAVPVTPGALPPVVDIEFYGDNCCFANKLRKIFIQSAKKKRRLKGF